MAFVPFLRSIAVNLQSGFQASFFGCLVVAMLLPMAALGQNAASAWQESNASRLRLISTGAESYGKTPSAVLQIALDPGFKTYWRNPGESGVPPLLNHEGSSNVRSVEMLFPVPERVEDETGVSIVYKESVLLPLLVTAVDPAEPVELKLRLQFGVCEKLCIPAEAEVALALGATPETADAALVTASLAALPLRANAADQPDLFALQSTKIAPPERRKQRITLRFDGAADAVFGEGPEGWFAEAQHEFDEAAKQTLVTLNLFGPRRAITLRPCPIRITLSGPNGAIERSMALDHCTSQP
jgi:DsbC/DsbD-like thiol-disulfide interchange protein